MISFDASRFRPDLPKTNQHDDPGGFGLTGGQRRLFMFFRRFGAFCKGPNWMSFFSRYVLAMVGKVNTLAPACLDV